MCNKKYHLIVMTKSPVLGTVKTRMQPQLTQQQSLDLHCHLTRHCLGNWAAIEGVDIHVWVGGDIALFKNKILQPLVDKNISLSCFALHHQVPGSLGEKISYAVENFFTHHPNDRVIIVGTDCPFIDTRVINTAILGLQSGHDVVINPAIDGGYVLLALKSFAASLFQGISWGEDSVYRQTVDNINNLGISFQALPELPDIDTPSDLKYLRQLHQVSQLQTLATLV